MADPISIFLLRGLYFPVTVSMINLENALAFSPMEPFADFVCSATTPASFMIFNLFIVTDLSSGEFEQKTFQLIQ